MVRSGIGAGLIVLVLAGWVAAARQWNDRAGSYQVEADLIAIDDGNARLQKLDGSVVLFPLARLSDADLKYLRSLPEYEAYFREHPVIVLPEEPAEKAPAARAAKPAWPMRPAAPLATIRVDKQDQVGEVRRFAEMGPNVVKLAISPDGGELAVARSDLSFGLFDIDKARPIAGLTDQQALGQVTALAFSPDGRKLLTGSVRGRISAWVPRRRAMEEVGRFVGHGGEITALAVSADGHWVLSGGKDQRACYWDIVTGREKFSVTGFSGGIAAVHLTPSGQQGLVTDGQTVALIDIPGERVIQTMRVAGFAYGEAAFSHDGTILASLENNLVRLWEVTTGRELPQMVDAEPHGGLAFLPDGKCLLTGGRGKVNVWEVASGRKLYEFDTAEMFDVRCVAASPDNRHFAAMANLGGQILQVFRLPAE